MNWLFQFYYNTKIDIAEMGINDIYMHGNVLYAWECIVCIGMYCPCIFNGEISWCADFSIDCFFFIEQLTPSNLSSHWHVPLAARQIPLFKQDNDPPLLQPSS